MKKIEQIQTQKNFWERTKVAAILSARSSLNFSTEFATLHQNTKMYVWTIGEWSDQIHCMAW